jgi:hypothetical protein
VVKEQLAHGQWVKWLRDEFAWTDRTARNMMSVAERFKSENVSDLRIDISALYVLAPAPQHQEVQRDVHRH